MSQIPELMAGRKLTHSMATTSTIAADSTITSGGRVFDQASNGVNVETLTGNKTLVVGDARFQKLDPDGSKDVILPAEPLSKGLCYMILNAAGGAENITVKSDAPATVVTLNQNEAAWVVCDGVTWSHMGVLTIALA